MNVEALKADWEGTILQLRIDASSINPGHSAGVETFAYGLIGGLAEVAAYNFEVEVLRGTKSDWQEQVSDGKVVWSEVTTALRTDGPVGRQLRRYLPHRFGTSRMVRHLINWVRSGARQDSVSPADTTLYPFPSVPVRMQPAVLVLHDLRWLRPESAKTGYASTIRKNVARASAVVVSWPHPFRQALAAFPEARDKLVLIPPPTFNARPSHRLRRPEADLLLYPSSTAKHKNHSTMLDAMAMLPEFRLICPGPLIEPQASALSRRASRPDIADRVSFPGYVAVGELTDLYSRAAGVVVPSTWEAASGAIFEAFSWGLPVACADVEPLRAQVEFADGDVCFFKPYDPRSIADAIRKLAAEQEHYAAASRHAGLRLAERTWASTAQDYADVFAWVAGGSRGQIPRSSFAAGLAVGGGQS